MKKYFIIGTFICCFLAGNAQTKHKWFIALSGGFGHQTAGSSKSEQNLINFGFDAQKVKRFSDDLRSGLQGAADIACLVNQNMGIGLRYLFFTSDGNITWTMPPLPTSGFSNGYILRAEETDYINYIGPALYLKTALKAYPRIALTGMLSGGYSFSYGLADISLNEPNFIYSSSNQNSSQMLMKLNAFGLNVGVGAEYLLTDRLALSLGACFFHASTNKATIQQKQGNITVSEKIDLRENGGESANLSRFDFSLGLKIYL